VELGKDLDFWLTAGEWESKDPMCCPSKRRRRRFRWNPKTENVRRCGIDGRIREGIRALSSEFEKRMALRPRDPRHLPEHHLWTLTKDGRHAEARTRMVPIGHGRPELWLKNNRASYRLATGSSTGMLGASFTSGSTFRIHIRALAWRLQ